MKIVRKDVPIIIIFAIFEPFLYFIFETYSIKYLDVSIVSIVIATIPVFTACLSKYYFKEQFSKTNMTGVIISIAGIVIMIFPEITNSITSIKGVSLAFLAVFSAVAYGFFIKKLSKQYNPVFLTAIQNGTGTILFLPVFVFLGLKYEFTDINILLQKDVIANILVLSVLCSSLAFIFFVNGIQKTGLGKSVIFSNLIPVFTVIIAFFWLGENFTVFKIIGIITVITGVFFVQKKHL